MINPEETERTCRRGLEILAERSAPIASNIEMLEAIEFLVAQLPRDLLVAKKIARDQVTGIISNALAGERVRLQGFEQTRRDCEALLSQVTARVKA